MKFYISGPKDSGEGVYTLLHAETGAGLAGHFCSNRGFAAHDLILNRPERKAEWAEEFGPLDPIELVWLGDISEAERDAVRVANEAWWQAQQTEGDRASEGAE